MATLTLEGAGILGSEPVDQEAIARLRAQRTPAEQLALDQAVAERGAAEKFISEAVGRAVEEERRRASEAVELQPALDAIDAALAPYLKDQLAAENAVARITPAHRRDFENFKRCCARWRLPYLPSAPQAVAVFLCDSKHEVAHISRLARSISVIHRALNFGDPTEDVLVRAIVRQAKDEAKKGKTDVK